MSILSPKARTRASPSCVMAIVLSASRCPRTSLVWSLSLGSSAGTVTGTAASLLLGDLQNFGPSSPYLCACPCVAVVWS